MGVNISNGSGSDSFQIFGKMFVPFGWNYNMCDILITDSRGAKRTEIGDSGILVTHM